MNETPTHSTGFVPTEVVYTIPGSVQTKKVLRTQKALDYQRQFCAQRHIEIHERQWTDHDVAEKRKTNRIAWLIVGGVAAGAMVWSLAAGGDSGSSGASPGLAFEMCKGFVKNKLKAPASATFRNFYDNDGEVQVTGSGDGPYTVRSTVDSENSFGAKIRSNFSCTVTASGDTWRASSVLVY